MRDLYKRLRISKFAAPDEVIGAVDAANDLNLKEDARTVLVDPRRRDSYDRMHQALTEIGTLRAHFRLLESCDWSGDLMADFGRDPAGVDLGVRRVSTAPAGLGSKRTRSSPSQPINGVIPELVRALLGTVWQLLALFMGMAILVGTFMAIALIIDLLDPPHKAVPAPSRMDNELEPSRPIFNKPPLPPPSSGHLRNLSGLEGIAPLEIHTQAGAHYLVRLENVDTGLAELDIFVRGGSTVAIEVPLGEYRVKYASGETWYGFGDLFGPDTAYQQASTNFSFTRNSRGVSGYTLTLYRVAGGNLRTESIPPERF